MSKFDELCGAYKTAQDNYSNYHTACVKFYGTLVSEFVKYLDCPREQVTFLPLDKEPDPGSTYSIPGAMHLDDDTYWHLGFRLTLYISPNTFPHQPILLRLLAKKVDDHFLVKLGKDGPQFKVHENNPKELEPFFDSLFTAIKEDFENGLQSFLSQGEQEIRRIGF